MSILQPHGITPGSAPWEREDAEPEELRFDYVVDFVADHGTIVIVWLKHQRTGAQYPVHFDHRQFGHMVEARGVPVAGEHVAIIDGGIALAFVEEDAEPSVVRVRP